MTTSLEAFKAATSGSRMSQRIPAATFGPQGVAGELALWGSSTDPAGVIVNERTALGLSAFWAGVTTISEAIATMPLKVWRRRKSGGRDWAYDHPTNYCLNKTTNGWQTPKTFKSFTQGCLHLSGNGCSEIIRNGRGQCVQLKHWLPRNTQFAVNGNGDPMYGITGNVYQSPVLPMISRDYKLPTPEWFPYSEVCHIKGFSTDGYIGLNTVAVARQSMSLGMTVEQFGHRFFTKGRPAGFITTKDGKRLNKPQRDQLRAEWKELYEGVQNALKLGVLSGGLDWVSMGYTNDDAQFLQTRAFQVSEVCRWLRISPHMLGDLSQVTEANIEQLMLEFITFTLLPWMVSWEEEMNLKLFTPMEQFSYYVEYDIDAFLRGDKLTQAQADEANVRNGLRTPQEIRDRDGWNPYEDGSGKIPLAMASQLGALKQIEDGTSPLQSKGGTTDSSTTPTKTAPKPKPKPKK